MEILFVENRHRIFVPYYGGALRTKLLVKTISEMGHVDIISFAKDEEIPDIPNCDILFSEKRLDYVNPVGGIRSMIYVTLWPENPYSYYQLDKKKEAIIDSFVKRKNYDIIVCRYVDTAIKCGLLKYGDRLILDMDDNPEGSFKLHAMHASSIIDKWKKMYKSKRIGRMLNIFFDDILCSFCSNQFEKSSSKTIYLHNTSLIPPPTCYSNPIPNRILFIGLLTYYPNKHGIIHFINEILPLIRHINPNVKLRVVGKGDYDFLDYLNSFEGVEAVGRVGDVAVEYQNAAVVVIPIYYGTGSSVKFVEALLMNRPVVSCTWFFRKMSGWSTLHVGK